MKKILAIILSISMLASVCCFNVSAAEETSEGKAKLTELIEIHDWYYSWFGNPRIYRIDEAYATYLEEIKVLEDSSATDEEYLNAANSIVDAYLNNLYIQPIYAIQTYEIAVQKVNYNNWYSEEEWTDFQNKIVDLKTEIDNLPENVDMPKELTNAFHALLESYNRMTNKYKVKGDLNKDGVVNVSDVTLLQKSLVDIENLTDAQKMLVGNSDYENPNIADATMLQKYIVGSVSEFTDYDIFISDLDLPYVDEDILMSRTLNFGICPRVCREISHSTIDNGYSGVDILYPYYRFCAENGYQP